jgi:AcrR family transcriptional regulator
MKREGLAVPIATIAADAGVGVGTLYRHFANREVLLAALAERFYRIVHQHAQDAAAADGPAIAAVEAFLAATIRRRDDLILPLHGGPVTLDQQAVQLRSEISRLLEEVLRRGRRDGTIRADLTGVDLIVFGALVAEPLPYVPDWDEVALRQVRIFLAGLANQDAGRLPGRGLTRAQLEQHLAVADDRHLT